MSESIYIHMQIETIDKIAEIYWWFGVICVLRILWVPSIMGVQQKQS